MGSPSWGRGAMVATSNPLAVEAALWAAIDKSVQAIHGAYKGRAMHNVAA